MEKLESHIFSSSAIQYGTYDPETQDMEIQWVGGRSYVYTKVTPEEWEELKAAQSAGQYMNAFIKTGHSFY